MVGPLSAFQVTGDGERDRDIHLTAELLNESRQDRRERFEALAFEHLGPLRAFASRLTRGGADTEDLVQETYLLAYRSFDRFQPGTNMKAWLFRIMKNSFISSCRKRSVRPAEVSVDALDSAYDGLLQESGLLREQNPEEALTTALFGEDVERALDSIAESYRSVLVACLLEGLSYREAAEALDIPEGTVMSRLHRGRRALQASLLEHAQGFGLGSSDKLEAGGAEGSST